MADVTSSDQSPVLALDDCHFYAALSLFKGYVREVKSLVTRGDDGKAVPNGHQVNIEKKSPITGEVSLLSMCFDVKGSLVSWNMFKIDNEVSHD